MTSSFIEQARRKQVIEAAIVVLAREGYANTSLSRIATQAGISKSIITYHFDGKDDLFEALFVHVVETASSFIIPYLEGVASPPKRVAAYIEAQLAFMAANRDYLLAIGVLAMGHTKDGAPPAYIQRAEAEELDMLAAFFEEGQCAGHFRAFDRRVMAQIVSKAIESALTEWAWRPETDLKAYGAELVALFERAMQADPND